MFNVWILNNNTERYFSANDNSVLQFFMETKAQNLGRLGEETAVRYLKNRGHKILARNYAKIGSWGRQFGEIDIITKKNGVIHFVEIKTSIDAKGTAGNLFTPESRVNSLKQRKLLKTAQIWLIENKISLDCAWQMDILSVFADIENKKAKVRYFENITA